jgi:hypothetical protein
VIRVASFYAALPSTTAVATVITAIAVVIAAALKAEPTVADPDTAVGVRSAVLLWSAGGSKGPDPLPLSVHLSFGKRESAHRSLGRGRLVACYAVLRMGAPEYSPWRVPPGGYHAMILTILALFRGAG